MTKIQDIATLGTRIDDVVLAIDYEIIAHFSRHLYGSPNRAVEELVSNAFDAFATRVYVYVPGAQVTAAVAVWDDGWAMDASELKSLWWVARSPKAATTRIVQDPKRGPDRKQIGKFGIGKLASYSAGDEISHLSRRGNDFHLVTVDYGKVLGSDGSSGSSRDVPYTAPIRALTKAEARQFVANIFDGAKRSVAVDELFDRKSWTLAVISKLKKDLTPGRLSWVIGNSMPERPDFAIAINDELVVSKLEKNAAIELDLGHAEVVEATRRFFSDARKKGKFSGTVKFGSVPGLDAAHPSRDVPFVELPALGRVWGFIRIFDGSLKTITSAELGRSWGFFVMVRDRLLNPDDAQLFLNDPSFAAFYRSQFVLHADGLDSVLLADRERLQRETTIANELGLLQSALYRVTRAIMETRDDLASGDASSQSLLPTKSRRLFREPLGALALRSSEAALIDVSKPAVTRRPLGEGKRVAELSSETRGFLVNTSHPYYTAIAAKIGGGKKAEEFFRIYDLFSVSERLLEGHLYDIGVDSAIVEEIVTWRDDLFRELARSYSTSRAEAISALYETSYLGNALFEDAVTAVLNGLGFMAERRGGAGKEDIIVAAAVGPDSYTFTFEAKGSAHPLKIDKAEVSGAASHRDAVGAEHAIVIAREFEGFKANPQNNAAGILKECRSVGDVSIMTVEALALLYEAVDRFGLPLDLLREVFTAIEPPASKLARIATLTDVGDEWDNRAILNAIWQRQNSEAMGDLVAYRSVYQSRAEWRKAMKLERFEQRLMAMETLANGRIALNTAKQTVYLKQSPDHIIAQIERSLAEG